MICTQFYEGQGLGNQLWAYVTLRIISERKSIPFGVVNPQYFKGFPFLDLDFGEYVELPAGSNPNDTTILPVGIKHLFHENQISDSVSGLDTTFQTLDVERILDSTKIQGNFQDHEFIKEHKPQISQWLKPVNQKFETEIAGNVCIINFRGGEYRHWKPVFLDKNYWHRARRLMERIVPGVTFKVITDDPKLAKYFFPADEVVDGCIAEDYLSIYKAKYLIVSNSSFAWFPAWLNDYAQICIAPKYWAGYNLNRFWSSGYTINPDWVYLDVNGRVWNSERAKITDSVRELISSNFRIKPVPAMVTRNSKIMTFRNLRWLPRRRRSRVIIWGIILARKLLGDRLVSGLVSRSVNLMKNTNYSHLQFPILYKNSPIEERGFVVDCFYFMDEFEILKLRLKILSPHVDKFVIVEARHTFTGKNKAPLLSDNLHLFEEFRDKMHIVVLENRFFTRADFYESFFDRSISPNLRLVCARTLITKNIPSGDSTWLREYFNKEFIYLAMDEYPPGSRAVVSDVDEIWNPEINPRTLDPGGVFVYKQLPFVYFMNNLSSESWRNWNGSVTATVKNFKSHGINRLRTHHSFPRRVIRFGGWHFSFQGGADLILSKLDSYGHQELNTDSNREIIQSNENKINDIRHVKASFRRNERLLPPEVISMKSVLPNWFL